MIEQAKNYVDGLAILFRWLGEGAEIVSQEKAEHRASICRVCPMNIHGGTLKATISDEIKRQVGLKNHLNLSTSHDLELYTCSVCSCHIPLKVWVPINRVRPSRDEAHKFHSKCWLLLEGDHE